MCIDMHIQKPQKIMLMSSCVGRNTCTLSSPPPFSVLDQYAQVLLQCRREQGTKQQQLKYLLIPEIILGFSPLVKCKFKGREWQVRKDERNSKETFLYSYTEEQASDYATLTPAHQINNAFCLWPQPLSRSGPKLMYDDWILKLVLQKSPIRPSSLIHLLGSSPALLQPRHPSTPLSSPSTVSASE